MSEQGNDASVASIAAEQPARRGALAWFSNREWALLLVALAVAIGGTAAAALSPDHSAASGTVNKTPTASLVASGSAAPAGTATPAGGVPGAAVSTTATSTATTTSPSVTGTVAANTTTASSNSETVATKTTAKKKKTAAKKKTTVPAAKVSFTVGSDVNFGTYASAPLRWRVLDIDDTSILLLSKYILSAGAFQSNWEGQNASLYSASEVRTWLRSTFTTKAFNTTETASLLTHVGGAAAGDRVFLLNAAEVKHYFPKAADRRAAPTVAAANDAAGASGSSLTLTGPYASWWLADAASDEYSAEVVQPTGKFGSQLVYYADLGVRPAIRVERDKIGFTLSAAGN